MRNERSHTLWPPQTRAYSSFLCFPSSPSPGSQLGRGPQSSHPWGLLWAVVPETVLSECPQLGLATCVPQDGPGVLVSGSRTSHIKGHCMRCTQGTSVHMGPISPEEGGLRSGVQPASSQVSARWPISSAVFSSLWPQADPYDTCLWGVPACRQKPPQGPLPSAHPGS